MKHRLVLAVALVLTCTVIAQAQAQSTAAGKWEGETTSGTPITLELTVKDTTLTGTMIREGERMPLFDGQVSKGTLTFKVKMNDKSEAFSGELTGEQLKVWLDRQGAAKAAIFKRVKG